MALVAVAAIVFALIVVLAALAFVRWSLRTIERKDRALEQMRIDSLERYGFLVGKNLEATPREKQAGRESALHSARREMAFASIVENPEQAVEMPSPTEARFRERMIFEELAERAGIEYPEELLADSPDAEVREPLFVDIATEAAV